MKITVTLIYQKTTKCTQKCNSWQFSFTICYELLIIDAIVYYWRLYYHQPRPYELSFGNMMSGDHDVNNQNQTLYTFIAVDNDRIEGKFGLKVFVGLLKETYFIKYTDTLEKSFNVALHH